MRTLLLSLFVAVLPGLPVALAGAADGDAAALLDKTGVKGGICLVVGAKDAELPKALAAKSALYVQALQPDAKLAAAWGAEFARQECQDREKLGVRNAAFEADHYGTNLLNLIVVEDAAALGKAKLADLNRILVPNGFVALKGASESFAAEAKVLEMNSQTIGSYAAVYRKPGKVEWKPPVADKWRAGSAAQYCSYFNGITSGDGRMFYRERMEVDGTLKTTRSQLFARDACNGRLLWTLDEPNGGLAGAGQWTLPNVGMEADNKGRLFVLTSEGKFVCLDAATGKLRFELLPGNAGGDSAYVHDDFVFAYGKVFSANDGKLIRPMEVDRWPFWKVMNVNSMHLEGKDSFYECDGKTLTLKNILDGKAVKTVPLDGLAAQINVKDKAKGTDPGMEFSVLEKYLLVVRKAEGGWVSRKITDVWVLDSASGKLLWSYKVTGAKSTSGEGKAFCLPTKDKVVIFIRKGQTPECIVTRIDMATGKVEEENRSVTVPPWYGWCFSNWLPHAIVGDYVGYHDVWINKRTLEVTPTARINGACATGPVPSKDMGLIYNFPSRKSNQISAIGPADPAVSPAPGSWKSLQRFGAPTSADPTREDDWPMFRGGPGRGNAGKAAVGDKPVKAWETAIGLGGRSYGVMCGERTGLTQPVSAYGLVIVSDLEGRRIVAVDAADGKQKWVFHVGSRVDYPPALYRGLCLFAAADGWVYCLDAKTGALVWKNMFAERERYAGGRDALESTAPTPWSTLPINSDRGAGKRLTPGPRVNVMVVNGVGYLDNLAFKPETGDAVPAPGKLAVGRQFGSVRPNWLDVDALLDVGNSPVRALEDRGGQVFTDGRAQGRVVSFDDALSVAYQSPGGEDPSCGGSKLALNAAGNAKWSVPIEMIVDDVVVTPARLYCVGHYQRVKKDPELWVMSREDGKVLNTVPVEGFPVFFGMSAAGDRLFVATREGKLICYQGGK